MNTESVDKEDLALALDAFVVQHGHCHRPIAVVSSGGTAVDLEVRAVRSLENFSTGQRGAIAVEGFLQRGYAVIHLWRVGSASPYARVLASPEMLGCGQLCQQQPNHGLNVDSLGRLFESSGAPSEDDDEEAALQQFIQEQQEKDPFLTRADDSATPAAANVNLATHKNSNSTAADHHDQTSVSLHRSLVHSTRLRKVLRERSIALSENRLLTVPFRTVEDYLTKLQACAIAVRPCHALALFFLAAAVSDFYIPAHERAEHKIQSSSSDGKAKSSKSSSSSSSSADNDSGSDGGGGGLVLHLKPVPKTIGKLRTEWAPDAFCVSFKLETDMGLLRYKAERAVQKYGCHMVIGNILETRHSTVWILAPPTQQEKDPRNGSSTTCSSSTCAVQDWTMEKISRRRPFTTARISAQQRSPDELEEALLDAVVQQHFDFLSWHFRGGDDDDVDESNSSGSLSSSSGVRAVRKTIKEMERKKQQVQKQLFWKRVQKTSLEVVGVALSILFSYAFSSALQRRQQQRHLR